MRLHYKKMPARPLARSPNNDVFSYPKPSFHRARKKQASPSGVGFHVPLPGVVTGRGVRAFAYQTPIAPASCSRSWTAGLVVRDQRPRSLPRIRGLITLSFYWSPVSYLQASYPLCGWLTVVCPLHEMRDFILFYFILL
jgi:hypothetical protein